MVSSSTEEQLVTCCNVWRNVRAPSSVNLGVIDRSASAIDEAAITLGLVYANV